MTQSNHDELFKDLRDGFQSLASRLDQTDEKIDSGFKEISKMFDGIGRYLQLSDQHLAELGNKIGAHDFRLNNLEERSN